MCYRFFKNNYVKHMREVMRRIRAWFSGGEEGLWCQAPGLTSEMWLSLALPWKGGNASTYFMAGGGRGAPRMRRHILITIVCGTQQALAQECHLSFPFLAAGLPLTECTCQLRQSACCRSSLSVLQKDVSACQMQDVTPSVGEHWSGGEACLKLI